MDHYYSPSTGGFYSEAVHGYRQTALPMTQKQIEAGRKPKYEANPDCRIPDDAVPVSEARWQQLLADQGKGQEIMVQSGRVVAADPAPAAPAEQMAVLRSRRNRLLAATDVMVSVPDYPVTDEQRSELIAWRAELRDITHDVDPAAPLASVDWPVRPAWLTEQGVLP